MKCFRFNFNLGLIDHDVTHGRLVADSNSALTDSFTVPAPHDVSARDNNAF